MLRDTPRPSGPRRDSRRSCGGRPLHNRHTGESRYPEGWGEGGVSAVSAPSAVKSPKRRKRSGPVPHFKEETALLSAGYSCIAGLDEVGRGPIAGPVVAGAVVLPHPPRRSWMRGIRDSKALTGPQREELAPIIEREALGAQVGMSTSEEIDRLGIVKATHRAMERALDSLTPAPQHLLLDAFPLPTVPLPQTPIIKGDAHCLSIAAASIVAKVARDRMMDEADELYPGYGFADHKGYATSQHLANLRRLGPSPIHRYSFAPVSECARSSG